MTAPPIRGPRLRAALVVLIAMLTTVMTAGCGSETSVDYDSGSDGDALVVYAGKGADRGILEYVSKNLLGTQIRIKIEDADDDANAKVSAGKADLAFYQHTPAFEADTTDRGITDLSIAGRVNVVPYALYSHKWTDLRETGSWVNTGLVADSITGTSLPHGARVALPSTPTGFARGLYLLQSAGLVTLDRKFGGTSAQDLTITAANVLDSARHLDVIGLSFDEFLKSTYNSYDAIVLNPDQAASLGLVPATDALAVEPGPGNPYAHVLVAPSRLAGDPRVLELTRALEDPRLAGYLNRTYRGANIAAAAATS
ncbi:MetQ/NlpA family ABC transporter substrate-binding protein [Gordonia sp. (in: high G+C Gram-positive bacteria)]|jgi:D-methionine transport system substrate-binding protein|uniref:MetQ/NlpA family ABC transporter substrate-binding protein n=3 Tax=Gordonia sp. (in: high G+C Gram-positive bacteria) TaxID=84139 RepID=UPI00262E7448|nr:MetQ/NlpA family ABC transporter substrate-binding protein [Gordonia sp. (in: high G+C Gram-positive bacteria)]HMS75187.1 MetQ/NlpA family ABC transporter substrate-binding protein [Gordonia sp. (in: high G+C Gram-positive bacteria)]